MEDQMWACCVVSGILIWCMNVGQNPGCVQMAYLSDASQLNECPTIKDRQPDPPAVKQLHVQCHSAAWQNQSFPGCQQCPIMWLYRSIDSFDQPRNHLGIVKPFKASNNGQANQPPSLHMEFENVTFRTWHLHANKITEMGGSVLS